METVHSNNRTLPLSARLPGLAGLAVFVFVTVLVQTRLLAGLDSAVAFWMASLAPGPLLSISTAFSIAFSAELSLIWAVTAGLVLWRRGLGLWSMAPLAFLIVTPVEILMKLIIEQPGVPEELHRSVYYPLTTLDLTGSFPSGHAIRSGFFCAFAGVLLRSSGGKMGRIAPFTFAFLAGLAGFTRLYLGVHWLTDVVAGLVLGASVGLEMGLLAPAQAANGPGTASSQQIQRHKPEGA
ncbi:MAG: phosphatase PAP2 family protein [Dehalococcoidia bacterium]|nr:phosphatase PAP2 family protein [Dehalococcoidia bacterium]